MKAFRQGNNLTQQYLQDKVLQFNCFLSGNVINCKQVVSSERYSGFCVFLPKKIFAPLRAKLRNLW